MDFKKIKQNGRRILIVGDIHGELEGLKQVLASKNWDKEKDLLISVGDLIDRGPDSVGTLRFAKENMECVLGNHDSFMVDQITGFDATIPTWMSNGGTWVVKDEKEYYKVAAEVGSWLLALPVALQVELDTKELIGIIHAEIPPNISDWDLFTRMLSNGRVVQSAIWGRSRIRSDLHNEIKGIKHLFVGHTVVNEWVQLGNIFYLDTGAVFTKRLTIAEISPTGELTIETHNL